MRRCLNTFGAMGKSSKLTPKSHARCPTTDAMFVPKTPKSSRKRAAAWNNGENQVRGCAHPGSVSIGKKMPETGTSAL